MSDNETSFTSLEFQQFRQKNGVKLKRSSPYHPATNGLAERAVQTVKAGISKQTMGSFETKIARFLFTYRNTVHATTGETPAFLLFGRKPRAHLDLLQPDFNKHVATKQQEQKRGHDKKNSERTFTTGQKVMVRDISRKSKWIPGTITRVLGTRNYEVTLSHGHIVRRHVDHIRLCNCELPVETSLIFVPTTPSEPIPVLPSGDPSPSVPPVRRSTRIGVPPNRYDRSFN